MELTKEYLSLLYNFTYIPIYYCTDDSVLFSLPAAGIDYPPPAEYICLFSSQNTSVSYLLTDFGGVYGHIQNEENGNSFYVGPVFLTACTEKLLASARSVFHCPSEKSTDFSRFFQSLPVKSLNEFVNYLNHFHYVVNKKSVIPHDIYYKEKDTSWMVGNHYALLEYNDKEMDKHNNSYFIEEKVLSYIEKGNVDALTNYSVTSEINAGTIADSTLRQMKNTCVVITTLASRAAIRGGLSTDIAFHLSDSYILQAEAMSNAEDINTLLNQILLDYTKRTANCQNLLSTDPVIRKVFQFVKHNTNRHITVDDVAEYVGFSRGYLSSMFNTRLGFKLSDFIRRCKLEEAKELLRFTDKSLSEISSYLCFSSQSHFQNLFKKQYGITPLQYRSQSVNLP